MAWDDGVSCWSLAAWWLLLSAKPSSVSVATATRMGTSVIWANKTGGRTRLAGADNVGGHDIVQLVAVEDPN